MAADPLPDFDLYAELEIPVDAPVAVVEEAWRAKVRQAHPDRASGPNESAATRRTARLNIARDWLTDPQQRAQYDRLRVSRPGLGSSFDPSSIDPLGHWPAPPKRRASVRRIVLSQLPIVVALLVMGASAIVGIGSNVVTIVVFDLGLVTVLYFGLFALTGAAYRTFKR
jgi:hypothetical protein